MSMSTQLSSSGAVPKAQVLTPSAGVLSSLQGLTLNPTQTSAQKQSALTADPRYSTPTALGTNPGMIQTAPTTPVKSTTDVSGNTTTYHAPKADPNVLAQQQALNAKGAGLVEDGIAGPKTEAAIAKYGTSSSATTSSTVPTPTVATPDPNSPVNKTTPGTLGNNGTNFQSNLANTQTSGQQTTNEAQTQQGVLNAGQTTPDEKAFEQQYINSVAGKQYGTLAPYAEASMYAGKSPDQIAGLINAPDLAGRSSADTGLYNALGSAYGNAALAGLTAAQTSAARNLSANTTAYSGAQTQANRATGANESVQGATSPQYGVQYGTQVGQPGQPNGGIDSSSLGGVAAPANIKSIQDYTGQINTTQKSVNTLNNLANQIIPNMGTTGFNPYSSPIGNQTFGEYFANSNPAASAGIKAGLGEIKNQISNVISSATGLTPTAVTGVTDSYDFTSMNPQQLSDFLQYINQYAQSNISGAQQSIDSISKGGTPNANPGLLPSPTAVGNGEAALGTGATLAQGFIQSILSEAGNAVAGAAAGATSGLAKSVLGL